MKLKNVLFAAVFVGFAGFCQAQKQIHQPPKKISAKDRLVPPPPPPPKVNKADIAPPPPPPKPKRIV